VWLRRYLGSLLRSAAENRALPRRLDAEDGAYAVALLVGCLVGAGLSWQTVLSEGARQRILGGLAGFATLGSAIEIFPPRITPPLPRRPADLPADTNHSQPKSSAMRQETTVTFQPNRGLEPERKPAAGPSAEAMPERLVLVEEAFPVQPEPARAGAPEMHLEVVFEINSSFLPAVSLSALRALVSDLPPSRPLRLALTAAVSDDRVKGAGPAEADRYNRWLAERRLDRVAAWLRQHARGAIEIEAGFAPQDSSRRVTISTRPTA
jgi:hypothetical protein